MGNNINLTLTIKTVIPPKHKKIIKPYELVGGKFINIRNSHQKCSMNKGVLRNLIKFTGNHFCQSLFFNKVVGLRPATLFTKGFWYRRFPVNFAKFLRTAFLQNSSGG